MKQYYNFELIVQELLVPIFFQSHRDSTFVLLDRF